MVDLNRDPRTDRGERITYTSSDAFEFTQILNQSAQPQEIFGDLELPDGEGPFPCVVMCHGSYGWRSHHLDYADMFHGMGIATFRPHSFEARGTREVSTTQVEVTMAMMIADAYAALKLLAAHPKIDATRVAIAGWSLGGGMAAYSAWEPLIKKLSPDGLRFAARGFDLAHEGVEILLRARHRDHGCAFLGEGDGAGAADPAAGAGDERDFVFQSHGIVFLVEVSGGGSGRARPRPR